MSFWLSNGHALSLGRELAAGGEGKILEVLNSPTWLAKLYHHPIDETRHRKLVTMVQLRTVEFDAVAAWPIDIITDRTGRCVGFIMPRISGPGVIDKLSHPAERRIAFPKVDYGFLIHVSMNVMLAAATLHAGGCVIGDVNESNLVVLADGTVRFIDVDSFQISGPSESFSCDVGSPLYTSPELQGVNFRGSTRSPTHDTFGLAVLVFQMLMQGRHPFAGIPSDGKTRTIEEAIRSGLYAYSPTLSATVRPPPDLPPLRALGELEQYFERAFRSAARPSAAEWRAAIERTRSRMISCERNPRHCHLRELTTCPLCSLPRDPFPPVGPAIAVEPLGGTSIGDLIRQFDQLPRIKLLAARTTVPVISIADRAIPVEPQPRRVPPNTTSKFLAIAGTVFVIAGMVIAQTAPRAGTAFIVGGVTAFASACIAAIRFERVNARIRAARRATWDPLKNSAQEARNHLANVESTARGLEWYSTSTLNAVLTLMLNKRESLVSADGRLAAALNEADTTFRKEQLQEYLERQFVSAASIPDIGPSRKTILASFGIETAADVSRSAIQRVAGFGPHLVERILNWRTQREEAFGRNTNLKPPTDWLDRVRQQHQSALATEAVKLRSSLAEYPEIYASCDRQLAAAAVDIDSAMARLRTSLAAVRA